jgi:hypothetical protein
MRCESNREHLFGRRHLQIQISRDRFTQGTEICILNVTPIPSQVNGDAVSPGLLAEHGSGNDTGLGRSPGLSHSGHVIDIDVKSRCHFP